MKVNFQIGQCRISADVARTETFYRVQPKHTELCNCPLCSYYEHTVITKPVKVFEILTKMGVDLSRHDKDDVETVWHIGERVKFRNSYLVFYKVFGQINKLSKKTAQYNSGGQMSVEFIENEPDSVTKYSFTQVDEETIDVRIEIECDRK